MPSESKTPTARKWVSFVIAIVIFISLWGITGHDTGIFDLPWWYYFGVILIQSVVVVIWNKIKPP